MCVRTENEYEHKNYSIQVIFSGWPEGHLELALRNLTILFKDEIYVKSISKITHRHIL